MGIKSVIKSNHDLKKSGYQIVSKLHKMERRKDLDKVYSAMCPEGYHFILSCQNLVDLIRELYSNDSCDCAVDSFLEKSQLFIDHLNSIASTKGRINKRILSDYLHAYTVFFNRIIDMGVPFSLSNEILSKWNVRCCMAYLSVWSI